MEKPANLAGSFAGRRVCTGGSYLIKQGSTYDFRVEVGASIYGNETSKAGIKTEWIC